MGAEMLIPDEVIGVGYVELMQAYRGAPDLESAFTQAVAVFAPLAIAAEFDRFADEWSKRAVEHMADQYVDGINECVIAARRRASELRGEA